MEKSSPENKKYPVVSSERVCTGFVCPPNSLHCCHQVKKWGKQLEKEDDATPAEAMPAEALQRPPPIVPFLHKILTLSMKPCTNRS
jgi:hypothetical protein